MKNVKTTVQNITKNSSILIFIIASSLFFGTDAGQNVFPYDINIAEKQGSFQFEELNEPAKRVAIESHWYLAFCEFTVDLCNKPNAKLHELVGVRPVAEEIRWLKIEFDKKGSPINGHEYRDLYSWDEFTKVK